MKDLVHMNATELSTILQHTERLAMHAALAQGDDVGNFEEPDKQSIAEAEKAAQDYAHARNSNARSRRYVSTDETASEGYKSALEWIRRKGRSALKK